MLCISMQGKLQRWSAYYCMFGFHQDECFKQKWIHAIKGNKLCTTLKTSKVSL